MTRSTVPGGAAPRVLLALRAGALEPMQIWERFPGAGSALARLVRSGLVERAGDDYRLTDAGRAACPQRRDL